MAKEFELSEAPRKVVIDVEDPDGTAVVNVVQCPEDVQVEIRYNDGDELPDYDEEEEEEEEDLYEDDFDDEELDVNDFVNDED